MTPGQGCGRLRRLARVSVLTAVLLVVSAAPAVAGWGVRLGTAFPYDNWTTCWYNQSGISGHGPSGYFVPMGYAQIEGSSYGGGCSHTFYSMEMPPYWMGIYEEIWYGSTFCFGGMYVDDYGYSESTPFVETGYWEIGWCAGYGVYDNDTYGIWDPNDWWGQNHNYGHATYAKNIQP